MHSRSRSRSLRNSIRDWSRVNGRLRRDEYESVPVPVPVSALRRSSRLAAKYAQQEASKCGISQQAQAQAHAEDRNRIIAQLAHCKCQYCVSETKCDHEASCEWCRTHPEWRMISHNLTILMGDMEEIRTKPAKISCALGIMSYINENAIGFAKAHQKFRLVTIDRCENFIADASDNALLCGVCSDVINKLKA